MHFATPYSGCMFCRLFTLLFLPPPIWCTKGGVYKYAIILAASQCSGAHRTYFHLCRSYSGFRATCRSLRAFGASKCICFLPLSIFLTWPSPN